MELAIDRCAVAHLQRQGDVGGPAVAQRILQQFHVGAWCIAGVQRLQLTSDQLGDVAAADIGKGGVDEQQAVRGIGRAALDDGHAIAQA